MQDVASPSPQLFEQHGLLGHDLLFTYSFRRSTFVADIAARWVWGSILPHGPEPDDEILKSPEEHGTNNPVALDGQEVNLQLSPTLRPEDDSDYQPSSSKMTPSNIQDISNLNGDSIMFNALPTKSNGESKMMPQHVRRLWKLAIEDVRRQVKVRRILESAIAPKDELCITCASMKLTKEKFIIDEYAKYRQNTMQRDNKGPT